jgi:hypothetical protein
LEAVISDQKSIGKPKAGVCTNYSPGGYKKALTPEAEKEREPTEGTVDGPVTAKPSDKKVGRVNCLELPGHMPSPK